MGARLEIANLTAAYGEFRALSSLSLTVEAGETLALVGANGAGKSTLMRVLTGLMGVLAMLQAYVVPWMVPTL